MLKAVVAKGGMQVEKNVRFGLLGKVRPHIEAAREHKPGGYFTE